MAWGRRRKRGRGEGERPVEDVMLCGRQGNPEVILGGGGGGGGGGGCCGCWG